MKISRKTKGGLWEQWAFIIVVKARADIVCNLGQASPAWIPHFSPISVAYMSLALIDLGAQYTTS